MTTVALTGPECSGKSTLSLALAAHFGTNPIPEYARAYLNELDRAYTQNDLELIAQKQWQLINQAINGEIKICDTEMLVIKIWSEEKYNEASNFIKSSWENQLVDLYVLCSPDIPFVQDGLRENQDDRDRLFDLYRIELEKKKVNFIVVTGNQSARLNQALAAISKLKN